MFADNQRGDDDAATELGEEVLVGVGDLFDEPVGSQALDQVRGPSRCERVAVLAQIVGAKTGDRPLAAGEGEEQAVIGTEEQVEAAEGAALDLGRCGHLGQRLLSGIGVVETGHEGEVTGLGGTQT